MLGTSFPVGGFALSAADGHLTIFEFRLPVALTGFFQRDALDFCPVLGVGGGGGGVLGTGLAHAGLLPGVSPCQPGPSVAQNRSRKKEVVTQNQTNQF